jgi:adenine-specific DNA-methyltransferase
MPRSKKTGAKRPIETYEHRDKERVNNPPVGLVTPETDPDAGQQKKTYAYDPHLDPQLVWAGKAEHTAFEVPTVSLHVHERIDPRTIIEAVRKQNGQSGPVQLGLFEQERTEPLREAIEFYRHKHGWTNRLTAGDSLLVMNSLLEKEGMAGKVQMIYMDPPYGIKYGSNFQPFVNRRDVKDGKGEDLTAEPEQIKAFRDTWELGIHSYLTYLRDRLLLARELLTESGSIFVQISDENVHHVRELMDEVFGVGNFVALIPFRKKTMPLGAKYLERMHDFLLWYSKNPETLKYHQLYQTQDIIGDVHWGWVELIDGTRRKMTSQEIARNDELPADSKVFRVVPLWPASFSLKTVYPIEFRGREYAPPRGQCWVTGPEGISKLISAHRIEPEGTGNLRYVYFFDDYPLKKLVALWDDTTGARNQDYVVQTAGEVIQRCLLMTTDPGDLVFDPTCGSGTTAYVAEQWGRRWITCDTSRVALALARQRLMTAVFDYYELAHPEEGVGSGFKYKTVPHVTLKSIANNPEIDGIYARMHPAIEQALAALNAALKGHKTKFKVTQGGRAGEFVDFTAPDNNTFTMPSGQVVKVNELVEWEVPFEFPADWPEAARKPFEAFHAARRAMQKAMDEAIARHAEQETLYDQPYVDRKRVRVSGPFTVEAVPAPVVVAPETILAQPPQPADASVARSGETLRQAEWRDELLKSGVRGKAGQYLRFSRLEPLPGCRSLHAVGETRPSAEGADSIRRGAPAYEPLRVAVSFGPEHAPLEPR